MLSSEDDEVDEDLCSSSSLIGGASELVGGLLLFVGRAATVVGGCWRLVQAFRRRIWPSSSLLPLWNLSLQNSHRLVVTFLNP